MFQRLSNLLFGEVEEVAAELKGPKPCVTEADEEGWMIVNLPGEFTAATPGGARGLQGPGWRCLRAGATNMELHPSRPGPKRAALTSSSLLLVELLSRW